jgi:hypothetical protein
MRAKSLREQAASCRQNANEFIGRPEQSFLLKMASALEELSDPRPSGAGRERPQP